MDEISGIREFGQTLLGPVATRLRRALADRELMGKIRTLEQARLNLEQHNVEVAAENARLHKRIDALDSWLAYQRNKELSSALSGKRPAATDTSFEASAAYWTGYNVTEHAAVVTRAASVELLDWRNRQYPGYLELMPVDDMADKVVLDYGCGPGHDLAGFAEYSRPARLIGIDISATSLGQAATRVALHEATPELVRLEASDQTLPVEDGSVDLVHCSGVLMLVPEPAAVLAEFRRVLKPGGTLRLMTYNYESLWLHLYVAFVVQVDHQLYTDLDVRTAFGITTDGEDCPLVRVWTPGEVLGMLDDAGFAARFSGAAMSLWEMHLAPQRFRALMARGLAGEHRAFLEKLEVDGTGVARVDGQVAGVDACFSASPERMIPWLRKLGASRAKGSTEPPAAAGAPVAPEPRNVERPDPARSGPAPRPRDRRRSVLFLHNSYYHFFYLAKALRARGWDALCVSLEPEGGINSSFYHGEDLNLHDPDRTLFEARLAELEREIPDRFGLVHFAGDGQMSLYPWQFDVDARRTRIPWDFLELKRAGVKIGYTSGGCADGISQSAFRRWSGGMCAKCTLENRPETCSDGRNLAWGHKREMFCDLNAGETLPALDYQLGERTFREPLTMCLDAQRWSPGIAIPDRFQMRQSDDEVLVFHGVGNYFHEHYGGNRDVKGTQAVVQAVDRLRAEGAPVRLMFVHDVPSRDMLYYQVQADIVVDQLNMGRYGANARECLMLGRPVIGRIDPTEAEGVAPLLSLAECPIVNATEATLYEVLKALVSDPGRRARLGTEAREYAVKWHSAEACAARFESVYDALMEGRAPATVCPLTTSPVVPSPEIRTHPRGRLP